MQSSNIGVTDVLAVYGAILASIGLGWNLYRDLLDRARLQLSARVRRIAVGVDRKFYAVSPDLQVEASEKLFVVMSVVNVGRRPVQWEGWGGRYQTPVNGKNTFIVIARDLPKMLKEGEAHDEMTYLETDLKPANKNVKALFIWDSSGKHWKLSRRQLEELKQEARTARI